MCLSCGSRLGFSLQQRTLLILADGKDSEHAGAVDAGAYRLCANLYIAKCNWPVEVGSAYTRADELCASCRLTRTPGRRRSSRRTHRCAGLVEENRTGGQLSRRSAAVVKGRLLALLDWIRPMRKAPTALLLSLPYLCWGPPVKGGIRWLFGCWPRSRPVLARGGRGQGVKVERPERSEDERP